VVVSALDRHRPRHVVLDPVMVAKSGDRLLAAEAVAAVRDELLPRVDLITPNLPEAADLLGEPEATDEVAMADHTARLIKLGAHRVLLKGGHLSGAASVDLFYDDGEIRRYTGPRIRTRNTHGTGCTLSSAIAVLRPQRPGWGSAIADARSYLTGALRAADRLDVGRGHGPVHHFHDLWSRP
jgi:hydroxymethylpyrimidine/phosphomethylpyrimidine kinase